MNMKRAGGLFAPSWDKIILPLLYGERGNPNFKLPDIPSDERIRVYTPKIRKHHTKRRDNKSREKNVLGY